MNFCEFRDRTMLICLLGGEQRPLSTPENCQIQFESVGSDLGKGPKPSVWYHRAQNIEFRDQNLTMALLLPSSKTFSKAPLFTDLQPLLLLKKIYTEKDSSLLVVKHQIYLFSPRAPPGGSHKLFPRVCLFISFVHGVTCCLQTGLRQLIVPKNY